VSSVALEPGPCEPWVTADDVAAVCGEAGSEGSNAAAYDTVAQEASQILFELSGRLYNGGCEQTVRPCRKPCPYWGLGACGYPLGLGFDSGLGWGWGYGLGGWGWGDETRRCGCGYLAQVTLAGYPVTEIVEVKIDGAALAGSEYRLDEHRYLTRLRDPAAREQPVFWPACQILDLEDTELGTWSVSYRFGVAPPAAGKAAAAQLACALVNPTDCDLPKGATRITRQGITIDRLSIVAWLSSGESGLPAVEAFLVSQPKLRRRPAILSPDMAQFPRPIT
jgi:hypothetical protein